MHNQKIYKFDNNTGVRKQSENGQNDHFVLYDQGYFEKIFAHTSKNKQNFQTLKILYYGKSKNLQILLYSIV